MIVSEQEYGYCGKLQTEYGYAWGNFYLATALLVALMLLQPGPVRCGSGVPITFLYND